MGGGGGDVIPSKGCLKRLILKSPKSSMFSLFSVTFSIIFINSSDHSRDDTEFLYRYPTGNGFVLESDISTQKHSIVFISRSDLQLTLFSIDL